MDIDLLKNISTSDVEIVVKNYKKHCIFKNILLTFLERGALSEYYISNIKKSILEIKKILVQIRKDYGDEWVIKNNLNHFYQKNTNMLENFSYIYTVKKNFQENFFRSTKCFY